MKKKKPTFMEILGYGLQMAFLNTASGYINLQEQRENEPSPARKIKIKKANTQPVKISCRIKK